MAYVKVVDGSYKDWDAIYNVLNYIFRYGDIPLKYVGGFCVVFSDESIYSDDIVKQFESIKIIYKKEKVKLLKHFVITFSKDDEITAEDACNIAWKFIEYFGGNYQIVFAVHTDTDNIHVHVVLNTTNILNGNSYSEFYEIERLNEFLNKVMIDYKSCNKKRLAIFKI